MLWIILTVIFIVFTIFAFIMDVTDTWCTDFVIPAISLIASVVFIIMYLTGIKECHINYDRACYEKQQIEFKGKLISQENSEEVSKWVNTAQDFNKRLFDCQTEIKYWRNFFQIRDKRYLDMESINIEGYIINVPAYKVILENR